jgi:hypothetical protein
MKHIHDILRGTPTEFVSPCECWSSNVQLLRSCPFALNVHRDSVRSRTFVETAIRQNRPTPSGVEQDGALGSIRITMFVAVATPSEVERLIQTSNSYGVALLITQSITMFHLDPVRGQTFEETALKKANPTPSGVEQDGVLGSTRITMFVATPLGVVHL